MTKEREQKYERIELTPLRLAIANRMTESKTTIPHAATKIGIDVTALVRVRSVLKNQWINEKGFCPTPFAFTAFAAVKAIANHGLINSSFYGSHIAGFADCNLAVTMEVADKGLMAPVIHKAQTMSFWEFAKILHELTQKAKAGDVRGMRFQDATFTVNNTGAYGSEDGYAVIMPPQAAILTVRKIAKTPVVTEEGGEERIVVRSIMPISLSVDHRIMDGKEATGYLLNIRELIEKGGCFDALE